MHVYTPLSGKYGNIFDFVIKNVNSIIHFEKWVRVDLLPETDEGILIWDIPENYDLYASKFEVLIFIPLSQDFVHIIDSQKPINRNLIQNFRFREDEFLALFPVNRDSVLISENHSEHVLFSADLFAQLFILLSGYDEIFSPKDDLNRNTYKGSLIEQFKLIYRALADETYLVFIHAMHSIGIPESIRMHKGFTWRLQITHDIDHLQKWTSGYFLRMLISKKHRNGKKVLDILSEMKNKFSKTDPYISSLKILVDKNFNSHSAPIFFLRSGYSDKRDSQIDYDSPEIKNLFELQGKNGCRIGIHPSIKSASDRIQFQKDWNEISTQLPEIKKINRQHFLMYETQKTPFIHKQMNVSEDYTLGFSDHEGLRRATVNPFYSFDFVSWTVTDVLCIPLVAMDATFLDYRKISATQAWQMTKQILDETIKFQGCVSVLIHNSYTEIEQPEWLGWFDQILDYGKKQYALLNYYSEDSL